MHQSFIRVNIFFILLIFTNHCFGMMTASSKTFKDKKHGNNTFLKQMLFLERLNDTSKLLLKDKPFDFSERLLPEDKFCSFSPLSSELDVRIVTLLIPDGIYNLNRTCKNLHEKLSFQKPYIWRVIQHNFNYITDDNMPRLLTLAISYNKKDIQDRIYGKKHENHIENTCSICNVQRFCPTNKIPAIILLQLFEETRCHIHHIQFVPKINNLALACYTGDITLITSILNKNPSRREISDSMDVAIGCDFAHVIPLLSEKIKKSFVYGKCFWYSISWCDCARKHNRIKAFEALIACNKNDSLNGPIKPGNNETYLDRLLEEKADQVFIDIVRKHGGQTAKEQDGLMQKCSIQ